MFTSLRSFLWRHKRKFLFGSALIGGTVLLSNHFQKRLVQWQIDKTRELFDIKRKTTHFESTERTCNEMILSLYKTLVDKIMDELSTSEHLATLRTKPANKVEIWRDIQVISFTRLCVLIYASTFLVALLRVQLNLMGACLFKNPALPSNVQERYLTACQRYLNTGVSELVDVIRTKCKRVLADYPLTKIMTLQDVESVFWSIQSQISNDLNDPVNRMHLMIATDGNDDFERDMLHDTQDLLESDELRIICSSNITRGLSLLIDCIAEHYFRRCESTDFIEPYERKIPMIKLIPVVSGCMMKTNEPGDNKFVDALITQVMLSENITKFGGNVYEAFCYDG